MGSLLYGIDSADNLAKPMYSYLTGTGVAEKVQVALERHLECTPDPTFPLMGGPLRRILPQRWQVRKTDLRFGFPRFVQCLYKIETFLYNSPFD